MLPGPVFAVELLTTARRARYFVLRTLYGCVLLFVFWYTFQAYFDVPLAQGRREFNPGELSNFALYAFAAFMTAQGIAILVTVPALVAGTIADEKQRKTLHYLLGSQLSSGEIVFGKLFARMLHVAVVLGVSLPIVCSLILFGGVDLKLILVAYGATASCAFFLASLAILCSTYSASARQATFRSYLALVGMIMAPALAYLFVVLWPEKLDFLPAIIKTVNPLVDPMEIVQGVRFGLFNIDPARLVTIQLIYSLLMLAWATFRLRPVGSKDSKDRRTEIRIDSSGRWRWRIMPKPPIGEDAMLWKERFTSRVGGYAKLLGLVHNLFWAVFIGVFAYDLARGSFREVWRNGYGMDVTVSYERQAFHQFVLGVSPIIFSFWLVGTTVTAAGSISTEREDDTWLSLLATPFEPEEYLNAKTLGAILRFRWLGMMLLLVWVVATIAGALHPVSLFLALCIAAVSLAFCATLGVRVSLTSRSTARALTVAFGWLAFVMGGYLLLLLPFRFEAWNAFLGGCSPLVLQNSLWSHAEWAELLRELHHRPGPPEFYYYYALDVDESMPRWMVVHSGALMQAATCCAIYSLATAWLGWSAYARFDAVAERPTWTPQLAKRLKK